MKHIFEEAINNLKDSYEIAQETALADYCAIEKQLIDIAKDYLVGATVTSSLYGTGTITEVYGSDFKNIRITIDFGGVEKRFSLYGTNPKFCKVEQPDFSELYSLALDLHEEIFAKYQAFDDINRKLALEASRKAEADKKAEAAYQKRKEQAIKDFNALIAKSKNKTVSATDDFYYTLGWLVKYASSISVALPDYLENAFIRYFGTDVSYRVVDSKKRSPAGWQAQWSWSFKVSLKKYTDLPATLVPYINSTGKIVYSTSFIWDLIDNYGFQFGKTQDIEKIRQNIPTEYILSFEEGLIA